MAKKSRKPRSGSPRTYAQLEKQTGTTPRPAQKGTAAKSPAAQRTAKSAAARSRGQAPAASAQPSAKVNFAAEYSYVVQDLRRIFILAGGMLVVLILLNFIVQ